MSKKRIEVDIPLSYVKLYKLVQHNIKQLKSISDDIENDTTYYVLHQPEALKDYRDVIVKLEEWEATKDILDNKVEVIVL